MTPLFDKQVSNETQEELPGSLQGILLCHLLVVPSFQASLFYVTLSVKLFQNQELEPRNGQCCHVDFVHHLDLDIWEYLTMYELEGLSAFRDQSWMVLPSRHWSLSATLAAWKVWFRL